MDLADIPPLAACSGSLVYLEPHCLWQEVRLQSNGSHMKTIWVKAGESMYVIDHDED